MHLMHLMHLMQMMQKKAPNDLIDARVTETAMPPTHNLDKGVLNARLLEVCCQID